MALLVFVAGALSWCEKKALVSGKQGFILYVCVLLGVGYWLLDAGQKNDVDLPFHTGQREVTLSGVVMEPVEHAPGRVTMIVAVKSVERDKTRHDVRGNLRLTWRPCKFGHECEPDTEVFRGDEVTVRARIRAPFGTRNPGGFDYGAYLRDHGIHAVAVVRGLDRLQVQRPAVFDFREWVWWQIDRWRNRVRQAAISTLQQPARGLFLGMIVGEQNDIPPDVRDGFMATGTVHIISISGSHLGLLAFVSFLGVRGITRRMPARWLEKLSCVLTPRQLAVLVTVPMVVFYTLLSGSHVATVRSLLMILLYLFAVWIGHERQIIMALGIAALCTTLSDPRALYDLSFQLSYVSVLAIALVFRWSTSDNEADEMPQAITAKVKEWGKQYALMTLAATVGTVPLVAYYFNQVAWLGLFANAVVVPFVGMLVVPLGLGASLIVLLGGLEHLPFGWVHQEIMDGLTSVVGMLAMVPGAEWHVASPSILSMAGFYLCLMMALLSRKRTVQVMSVSALVFCLLWWTWSPRHVFEDGTLRVTFLDVGQGDATVIELPGGDTILVDGGAAYERWDIGRMVVGPYLWDRGIRRLTHVIATHPQLDHVGGLAWIIDNFEVDHYWSNGIQRTNRFYQRLRDAIAKQGLVERIALEGEEMIREGPCRLVSLNPPSDEGPSLDEPRGSELNNLSVVLSLTCGQHSILLTADAEVETLTRLIRHPLVKSATVVKIPHHGAKSSLNRQWIQQLNAKTAVVSAGQGNRYGHPADDVLQAYERMTIYRTDSHGAIVFSAKPDAGEIRVRRTTDRHPVPLDLSDYSPGREWENLSRFWKIWVRNA